MLLITQPRAGRLHNEIIAVQTMARELGWDVHGAHFGWRLPDEIIASKAIGVPYGSQTFCEVISQQMNWLLTQNSFDWLANIPKEYLKRDVSFALLSAVRNMPFDKLKFIKPADDKCFDAKIYQPGEFNPPSILPHDTPVLISDPVEFVEEYRCFVTTNKCATVSCYLYHGEINEPHNWYNKNCYEAKYFVEDLLLHYATQPSVVDVGLIKDVGWAVIESNQAWASGIYGCEPYEVLSVLEQTCRRDYAAM